MSWNPDLYARFEAERGQPFLDLMARVPDRRYTTIADLGCGTGTNTAWLAARHPDAHVVGIDASTEMLAKADTSRPNVTYLQQDIATWTPDTPFEFVVSNAALHWLADHERLVPRLAAALAPGGVLAFQVPANHDAPSHHAVADVAADEAWADRVQPRLAPGSVLPLERYDALLSAHGLSVTAWDHVYEHRLPGIDAILDWLSGTTLHAALDTLDDDEQEDFLELLHRRLAAAYGDADVITFPFRRRFVVASDQTG